MIWLPALVLACTAPRPEPVGPAFDFEADVAEPTFLSLDDPWPLQTPKGAGPDIHPTEYLVEVPCPELGADELVTDPEALAHVAESALARRGAAFPARHGPGLLGAIPAADVDEGLRRVLNGDALDPVRREQAFRCVAWLPDHEGAAARDVELPQEQIQVTPYLAWRVEGRAQPEGDFDTALYAVPEDEAGLSGADLERRGLLRNRFTRREVNAGVFEPGGAADGKARPLVWLKRSDAHQAQLQGTVVVRVPGGRERTYNVHRNNGIAWDPARVANPDHQDRYWYFREVPGVLGFTGETADVVDAGVIVAGDIPNLGLGVPMILHWRDGDADRGRVVILADTGGAFQPNLFQLDWLVGTFATQEAFAAAAAAVPDKVHAVFMVPREG